MTLPARRPFVFDHAAGRPARRLRHLLPADHRYGSESQLALNPRSWSTCSRRESGAQAPVILLRTASRRSPPPRSIPRRCSGASRSESADADRAPVQRRPRDPPERQHIARWNTSQHNAPRPQAAQYQRGVITAGNVVVFPYRPVRVRQRVPGADRDHRRADYHALQTRLQRRFSGGLSFTTSFTVRARAGNFLDHLSAAAARRELPLTAYDPSRDYGRSPRHPEAVRAELIYEVPVGRGRRFQPRRCRRRSCRQLMINGILTLNDGRRSPSLPQTERTPVPAASRARTGTGDPLPSGFGRRSTSGSTRRCSPNGAVHLG